MNYLPFVGWFNCALTALKSFCPKLNKLLTPFYVLHITTHTDTLLCRLYSPTVHTCSQIKCAQTYSADINYNTNVARQTILHTRRVSTSGLHQAEKQAAKSMCWRQLWTYFGINSKDNPSEEGRSLAINSYCNRQWHHRIHRITALNFYLNRVQANYPHRHMWLPCT